MIQPPRARIGDEIPDYNWSPITRVEEDNLRKLIVFKGRATRRATRMQLRKLINEAIMDIVRPV